MHGTIIQLDGKPMTKDDYIDEDSYFDAVNAGSFCDYVDKDIENPEERLKQAFQSLGKYVEYNEKEHSVTFKAEFAKEYFDKRFKEFKDKAYDITLDDFCFNPSEISKLCYLIDDQYDIHIYYGTDDYSLDSFIRENMHDKEDAKFYIGAVLDYHY